MANPLLNNAAQLLPDAMISAGAPMLPNALGAPERAPDLGAQPVDVKRAPSPLEQNLAFDQGQLQKFQYKQNNPWGTANNHPGTMGKIAHVLSVAGNIAGDIVAPNIMSEIPGTQLNTQAGINQGTRKVATDSQDVDQDQQSRAATAKTQQETAAAPGIQQSEEALRAAQTNNLLHPKATNEFELWRQQNPNGTAQQYNDLMSKQLTDQDAASRNAVWDTIADKYHLPKGQFRAGMSAADAGALATALNNVVGRDQGGQKIIIQGQNAANAAQKTRDGETNKEFNAATKDLGSQFAAAQMQAETLATARQELGSGAVGQAVGTIKTLVGLAGGKGTGVRITQAELNALAHARGIQGSFEGYISGLEGKGNLAPEQLQGMQQLLTDVEGKIREKMSTQDGYLDRLSSATSTQEIRQIQSEYRKELMHPGGQQGGSGAPPPDAKVRDYSTLRGK